MPFQTINMILMLDAGVLFVIGMFILVPLTVLAIPIFMIWTHHRRKMEEIRLQRVESTNEQVRAEFQAVREEIRSLRDTCTQYDLSFDSALHRVENRLSHLESQSRPQTTAPTEQQNVYLGGRS